MNAVFSDVTYFSWIAYRGLRLFGSALPGRVGLMVGLCLLAGTLMPVRGQDRTPTREYEIKAAFLYQFARFVEWPVEKSGEQLVVCVLGENPFGTALDNLEGKSIGTKSLTTRHLTDGGEVSSCHMLFLSSSTEIREPGVLTGMSEQGVLTVGETETFNDDGGIIRLFAAGNNIRFAVNRDAARRAGLQISSRMLRLAANS